MIPKWRFAVVVVWAVFLVVTFFSLPGSVIPAVNQWVNTAEHAWRIPIAVLITSILSTPFISFLVIPLTVHFARPLLVTHRPKWRYDHLWIVRAIYIVWIG
jgi:antibiotic biosynthesis monooxygenase (ABM) superfamily enzyme